MQEREPLNALLGASVATLLVPAGTLALEPTV
jgi:hypothetical protein